uniref:Uncharacterized protein n=1 Tax=Meloidogyne hapla TaxID=6305 RepID=A0A1I8BG32_MELHA
MEGLASPNGNEKTVKNVLNSFKTVNWLTIASLVSLMLIPASATEYKKCSRNGMDCGNVLNLMVDPVTKCTELVLCYESQFTNPVLNTHEFKLPALYKIRPGNSPRICQDCIDEGSCMKANSKGEELQWNGFKLFINIDTSTIFVHMDMAGRSAVARCWSSISTLPPSKICQSCYLDEGRMLALRQIDTLISVRILSIEQEAKVLESVTKGTLPANDKQVNDTLIKAVWQINNGYKIVAEAEAELAELLNNTREDADNDLLKAKASANNNNIPETQILLESAAYKATIIQMASAEFFKEKFATYNYGEITLVAVEKLKKLVEDKIKDEL